MQVPIQCRCKEFTKAVERTEGIDARLPTTAATTTTHTLEYSCTRVASYLRLRRALASSETSTKVIRNSRVLRSR